MTSLEHKAWVVMATGALALSSLGCHKVRSIGQLAEPNIAYHVLAQNSLVVGASSRIMIARTRSSGVVEISKASSNDRAVVEITATRGHVIELVAKSPGNSQIVIDASSPEGIDRRFVVPIRVTEPTAIELSYCGSRSQKNSTSVAYISGYPARIHRTYRDAAGPISSGNASGAWSTPPAVEPEGAAAPSGSTAGGNGQELLLEIPAEAEEPFEVVSPLTEDGKTPSRITITPTPTASVSALTLAVREEQSIDKVQPLDVTFWVDRKPVCSLIPFTAHVDTPRNCELLLQDGTAARQVEVEGTKHPWVRLISPGICVLSVSAKLPTQNPDGAEARTLTNSIEIKGFRPSDDLPR